MKPTAWLGDLFPNQGDGGVGQVYRTHQMELERLERDATSTFSTGWSIGDLLRRTTSVLLGRAGRAVLLVTRAARRDKSVNRFAGALRADTGLVRSRLPEPCAAPFDRQEPSMDSRVAGGGQGRSLRDADSAECR